MAIDIERVRFREYPIPAGGVLLAAKPGFSIDNTTRKGILELHELYIATPQQVLPSIACDDDLLRLSLRGIAMLAGDGLPEELRGPHNFDRTTGEFTDHIIHDPEETVGIAPGPGNLFLVINSTIPKTRNGRRYFLAADLGPAHATTMLFGVREDPAALVMPVDASMTATDITPGGLVVLRRDAGAGGMSDARLSRRH